MIDLNKDELELLAKMITIELYKQEHSGLDMSHYSELGWRLAVFIKNTLKEKKLKPL